MKLIIKKIIGREVLDSRGNPTVEAEVHTKDNIGRAIVPSGASTGIHECVELRDNKKRFLGKGVRQAVQNIKKIDVKLKGMNVSHQTQIDEAMIQLDGTANKKKLGSNAMLAVSMACTRAATQDQPLFRYVAHLTKQKPRLPIPFANIINGGKHAGNKLAMQEFMIVPYKAKTFRIAAQLVSETYHILKGIIEKKYGKNAANVGDEGGFAPPLEKPEQALDLMTKAVEKSGHAGTIKFAMDPAASEFYSKGKYLLHKSFTGAKLSEYYLKLAQDYPIISIEDPFDEDDFENFRQFSATAKFQVVGDDLTVTNPSRIKLAVEKKLCNALLLKVNQIGTITEAVNAFKLAKKNGWNTMVSHRSGETEDPYIADFATGLGTGQIKLGAPCRGERTAKYNQLLRLEEYKLPIDKWNSWL